ncbi:MAG: hypothetical protein LBS57_04950 [Treponema sp.]|jgi:hypothetical protein|nr:hypothetical protein [Treponema sp.]
MNKNTKFNLVLPLSLLVLNLAFVSCDNGTTSNTPANRFTITGITTQLKNYSEEICIVGLYPVDVTVDQALSDVKKIYKVGGFSGSPEYCIAGREVYHSAATGTEGNWTESGTLKSASSGFDQDWRGSGTFISYWLLQDTGGTYRAYKLKSPRTISEGDHTFVHAVNDFELVLTQ